MLRNMVTSLFEYERIMTTKPKAKEARKLAEKLITLAKQGTLHARRLAISKLGNNKEIVKKLFDTLAPRYAERKGGYTRIMATTRGKNCAGAPYRLGDNADMCYFELVDAVLVDRKKKEVVVPREDANAPATATNAPAEAKAE